jgi:trimethylamine---corrinoid protein Co-methyltransferase
MDCEYLQQIQRYFEPATWATTPEDIALDAIGQAGETGHFFGLQHTQDRYTTAFYQPFLSDWRNYEGWNLAGGVWTHERAHRIFKDIVGAFEPPPMDEGHREALADFVARRKAEGGAPDGLLSARRQEPRAVSRHLPFRSSVRLLLSRRH